MIIKSENLQEYIYKFFSHKKGILTAKNGFSIQVRKIAINGNVLIINNQKYVTGNTILDVPNKFKLNDDIKIILNSLYPSIIEYSRLHNFDIEYYNIYNLLYKKKYNLDFFTSFCSPNYIIKAPSHVNSEIVNNDNLALQCDITRITKKELDLLKKEEINNSLYCVVINKKSKSDIYNIIQGIYYLDKKENVNLKKIDVRTEGNYIIASLMIEEQNIYSLFYQSKSDKAPKIMKII